MARGVSDPGWWCWRCTVHHHRIMCTTIKPTHIDLPSFSELVTSLPKRSDKNAIFKSNIHKMAVLLVHHNHHSPDGTVSRPCLDGRAMADNRVSNVLTIEMTHILEGMFLANISKILKCYSRTQQFLTIVLIRTLI